MKKTASLILSTFLITYSQFIFSAQNDSKEKKILSESIQNFFDCYKFENKSTAEQFSKSMDEAIIQLINKYNVEFCLKTIELLISVIDYLLDNKNSLVCPPVDQQQLKKFKEIFCNTAELETIRDILFNKRLLLLYRIKKNFYDFKKNNLSYRKK